MSIVQEVGRVWKGLSRSLRRWVMNEAMRGEDAGWRMRCKVIRNLVRGESPTQIHRILGCARSHVYDVAAKFVEHGVEGLEDGRESNGSPKVTTEYAIIVLAAVSGSPLDHGYERPTWTQELLVLVAGEQTGIQVSTTTMSRLLANCGVRHGRPKPRVECPWPKAAKTRRLNAIRRLAEEPPPNAAVLYVDEVDVHLNPKIGPDWMLEKQQKDVLTPGQNAKHYLAGALDATTGRLQWVAGPKKTSALFIALVDHLLACRTYLDQTIHLVLDNFRIHSSRAVAAAQLRWGERVQLHFLPPYCPDHNRIERLWKDLHDNVTRNHRCQTMDELLEKVRHYLNQRKRGPHKYVRAE